MTAESADKRHTDDNPRAIRRARVTAQGIVQGVGFRPFVYRLATELNLAGWVNNSTAGVTIELEGPAGGIDTFIRRLNAEKPAPALIKSQQVAWLEPAGYSVFTVRESDPSGEKTALVLPDIATCPDCLREITDPADRRFRYPFTNCTNCGPRYSIIESLPYDRANTTMKIFPMCPHCRREYEDPANRRFHAQPNACPVCGPHIELWDKANGTIAERDDALPQAAAAILEGKILALKGLGGFQLLAHAGNEDAVRELRLHKAREEKPFALMVPNLESARQICELAGLEEQILSSSEAPIVLVKRKHGDIISPSVAPSNPYLGIMLPYTPLHHLLMAELNIPVIATSGNLTDEPICIDEREAIARLGDIADLFLVHNRPIARQVDDSVVRVVLDDVQVVRNARGYAPSPLSQPRPDRPTLAVGAHLKNSIAVGGGNFAFLSQHIGDLETARAYDSMVRTADSLAHIYDFRPEIIACDLHPDYLSTRYAQSLGLPIIPVQHHYAHVLACLADNEIDGPVLGVSWDGTGYGPDDSVWGGEFLRVDADGFTRVGHFRTFKLPGGEKAISEPCRSAMGLLYEIYGDSLSEMDSIHPRKAIDEHEAAIIQTMLKRNINSPITSSAGRLFDAVASLIGVCHHNRFEGQAAMMLEWAIDRTALDEKYPFRIMDQTRPFCFDWEDTIRAIMADINRTVPVGLI
ncbi:MAG: carbamoyltransferase HypF, partial [candidate division Zixibacteria bacterium]|nr:carbamoyltransferase HypF [candidate division Zixibacteria bacterium]